MYQYQNLKNPILAQKLQNYVPDVIQKDVLNVQMELSMNQIFVNLKKKHYVQYHKKIIMDTVNNATKFLIHIIKQVVNVK